MSENEEIVTVNGAPLLNVVDRFAPISDQQIRDIMDCGDPSTARIKICRLIYERTKPAPQDHLVGAGMSRLRAALQSIIDMNVQYAADRYGDASQAESMACVITARAALAATEEVR